MIIDFGKHAGESIYSVIKRDYGYCRWLAAQRVYGGDTEIGRFLERQFGLGCGCGAGLLIQHRCQRWRSSRDTRPIGHST